jgi:hypothetical protein
VKLNISCHHQKNRAKYYAENKILWGGKPPEEPQERQPKTISCQE